MADIASSILNYARQHAPNAWTLVKDEFMGSSSDSPWPLHLAHILLGYALVVVPAAGAILWIRSKHQASALHHPPCRLWEWAVAFAVGSTDYDQLVERPVNVPEQEEESPSRRRFMRDCIALLVCFAGIQTTLVGMGWLQERIITRGYKNLLEEGKVDRFGDAQFLVFCNRIVALGVCAVVMALNRSRQPVHKPPYYKHAYTSFSNTMSSWCQYEALKFVSFPTQTICKASKVVATMAMGTVVRGQRYSRGEYACGAGIAIGASLFLLSAPDGASPSGHERDDSTTTISGLILMGGYLVFDAFTLNWQKALFDTKPKISKWQMMLGVNFFSAVLCIISLWEQGSLAEGLAFASSHEEFAKDAFLLSLSGAAGQLFIYTTIDRFGPIVFAVIMTIRQMVSIVVSTISYGHAMTSLALIGFVVVFGSIFLDIYRRYFERRRGGGGAGRD